MTAEVFQQGAVDGQLEVIQHTGRARLEPLRETVGTLMYRCAIEATVAPFIHCKYNQI
jgi:hypothetical protein